MLKKRATRPGPPPHRSGAIPLALALLEINVMKVLVADMVNAMAVWDKEDGLEDAGTPAGEPMSDEDADFMGRWWYEVAAGEVRPA